MKQSQPLTHFPESNRASFYRDLNARAAEAVHALVPRFPGGPLVERRFSEQAVPRTQKDLEEKFFYCALQPVQEGLCERISDYPGYNSFHKEELKAVIPGTLAKNPKKSKRNDRRPLIVTTCLEAKKEFLAWYFSIVAWYKRASAEYLAGDSSVEFPPGTYKPPGPFVPVPT